jgi:putative ABC transport system substrate-binding protein
MQLMMYRYLFPEIKKIGVLYNEQYNQEWLTAAIQAAHDMGMDLVGEQVSEDQNLSTAIEKLLTEVDALWLIADPLVMADRASVIEIFQQAEIRKKPVFTYNELFIDFGAILVISADIPTIGRQASAWVEELRNDETITERVSNPIGSYIILNMKKIKEYQIRLNKEALGSVNQIIE